MSEGTVLPHVVIYTDGGAAPNPGPGGWAAILKSGEHTKELKGGEINTTNNRMELMAVIAALQLLNRESLDVVIYSDSSYVVNAVEKGWLRNWLRIGFKGKKNADLWSMYAAIAAKHNVRFVWVKGHADNPLNNRCDMLATAAADSRNWLVDEGYEAAERWD